MRALVTGATGFVGGALTRRLLELGFELHALVRKPSASELDPRIAVHPGELGDPNTIADAAQGCELVFHCAGESSRCTTSDALAWVNVAGTENVIAAARHAGVARVVVVSCADVSLANRDRLHWKENAVLGHAPLGAFARSKLLAEELALHASDRELTVTALRPAWLWGPGDFGNLPALCREALHGGIRMFSRGAQLFATTYIDNLVDAMIAASRARDVGGQAFHVADSDVLTAREFFDKLCAALELPPPRSGNYALAYAAALLRAALGVDGPRPDEIARRGRATLLDCLRAVERFDYAPRVGVEDGMRALAEWARAEGGARAIASRARAAAGASEVARHRDLADASHS